MVNSGSFDSDGQGDRNAKVGCTQPHNASDSTQSSSPVTASAATPCKTDFSQTADSDLPSVAHAIEPTPTKTEFNCDMPVENFTNLSSVDGAVEESENPPVSASEDERTSLCCSLPLDKVQGVLTPYHPSVIKPDDDGTKVKQPSRKLLCLYCDRSFVSANLRQKHVERVHSVKQNRRFSSRRQNQLTVTPCVYCDKINGTENTLKDLFQHLINEHSSKYFGCLPCEDRFLTSSLLADHNASNHNTSAPQTGSNFETPAGTKKTTLIVPTPVDGKSESGEEDTEEIPVKLTRSRMRPKPESESGKGKKAIIGNKKKSTKLKEMRTKKLSVKSSRIALKRRESKRLQAIAKIADSQKKKRQKPGGAEKKQSNINKLEQINSTKSTEKAKSNSTCINPYPEFDHFYRVKKITDHSIDNLKISSLTFDDVFDKAFFNRIKCNIEENLLHHIDGKLFKNEESESRISNFEKVSNVPQEIQNSNSENFGCELSLNAVTPVASLSLNSQFGEDFESQIEYGSKPSKKKTQTRKDEVHYKYFTRRKYQASILEHKENRDLSKLDMWTQLVIKKRQQKMLDEKKTAKEILEYTTCDEYKNKMQREELNRILDRRGPFEDLKEEASKKAALDKLNSVSEDSISQESFTEVREILNEILNRVFAATEEVTIEVQAATEKAATCSNKKADQREIPAYLNLRRSSSLPSDGEIDKSDKIALICSSQETENFELPTNQVRGKNELIELTGEWARCRMYICAACGAKLPNMKYLLEHKSIYHQNVWVQHYEFVGNQSELYRHLSIPALGKVGAVEESVQCKVWRRSDARVCTKCGKQCNALGELHRHILECGGDWTWMLARKKCKYRPFGAKSRRKRRGLLHRFHLKQKTEPTEKRTYKKAFDGPRQKPSDADTIQRMLANLPAKRSTRKLISLHDGIYRARKKSQMNNINQNKIKCGKVIYKSSGRKETTEKTINTSISVTSKKQKNQPSSNRRSLRSLNKVLASRILDTNSKLSVKRKIKVLNDQRRTRRSQLLTEEIKDTVLECNSKSVSVSPSPTKTKTKLAKKENKDISDAESTTKRSSPRSSPKNVKKKMSVKKLLTGKINIKSFFPVKKKKNRKSLTENQKPQDTKSEVENTDVKTRSKRKSKEIVDTEEEKKEEMVIPKIETKKTKSETFSNLVRSLSIHKKKSTKTSSQDTNADATLSVGNSKKQIMVKENAKSTDKDEQTSSEDNKETNKKRKLKRSFRNVINRVKKLKIDHASESAIQVQELHQNEKNHTSTFLEESIPEESVPPAQPEQIVIPSISEAKENTADISIPAPIVMDFHETNENPPIPETIFKLESNNEKSLQAKGELDFDTQPLITNTNSTDNTDKVDMTEQKTLSEGTVVPIEYNEKTQPISIETSVKPKIVPLVSPNMKGKIRKPTRGLNDCIAMLTSKLQQKIEEKPGDSVSTSSTPNTIKEACPIISECILRIPTFKSQKPYLEVEETALDLSTKSISNTDPSEKQGEVTDLAVKNSNSEMGETNKIKRVLSVAETVFRDQTEIVYNSVDRIIEEVVGNKIPADLHKWNSIDEIIQAVVDNHHPVNSTLPTRNTIDEIIDFVVEYGNDRAIVSKLSETKAVVKANKTAEKLVRKIGSVRKPKNKKSIVEAVKLNENVDDLTPKVVDVISKEQVESTVAIIEEKVENTESNVENSSLISMKATGSLKKKKNVLQNENDTETKPKKVVEKTRSTVETSNDDIESKNILEKIDAYLNEAFIETSDAVVSKISSTKSKKSARKIGQVRNRSRSNKNCPTENNPSDKKLLETNLDTLSDVKEINVNPEMPMSSLASQNTFVHNETTMTKGEEIKQLSNEDEPHLLENKVMTSQLKTNVLQSDSEDDIPLAALVKPDEFVKDKCEDKTEQQMEDRKINLASTSTIDATSLELLPPDLADAEIPLKKVTKRRSKSNKSKNENPKDKPPTIETISSGDDNTEVAPSSIPKNEESFKENNAKSIIGHANNGNATKKRSRSLKDTRKPENDEGAITLLGVNEEITVEDVAFTKINTDKKVQRRKSRSCKRTEDFQKLELNDNLDEGAIKTVINLDIQFTETSVVRKQTKSVHDLQVETDIEISNSNETCPEVVINNTSQTGENNQTTSNIIDAGDGLIEPLLGNKKLPTKPSENISDEHVLTNGNVNPDSQNIENTTDLTKNIVNTVECVDVIKIPKRRGRPPKKKNSTVEANATALQSSEGALLSENAPIKSVNEPNTNFIEQINLQSEDPDESAKIILPSAEHVIKKRSRSSKKKSLNDDTEDATLISSSSSLLKDYTSIESPTEDTVTNFIGITPTLTESKYLGKNILDSAGPVAEMKKLDRRSKSPRTENLSVEAEETRLMFSSLLNENFGIESSNKKEITNLKEQTYPTEPKENILYSGDCIVQMKKPVKRRSRSKKNSLNDKTEETTLESSITSSLSEDIGIGSSNEEVESYLIESQPEFAEPEVKSLRTRKKSKSVKRKNSRIESPIDSLLSDSSLNSSEVSEDFGETQPIIETMVKKIPKRRSRSQKSQSPLEEDISSNTSSDTLPLDVGASVLNENIVTSANTNKKIEVLPQNAKKRSKSLNTEVDESLDSAVTDISLNEASDSSRDPVKNLVNKKTQKGAKMSKVKKTEAATSLTEFLETNYVLSDKISEKNDRIETELVEPEGKSKRRSRSVRKKPIIECSDSEEEIGNNFINDTHPVHDKKLASNIGKAEAVLSVDNAYDFAETKKANRRSKSLKNESLTCKSDQLTTTDVSGLSIKTDDIMEDFVKPEVKIKKSTRGRPRLSKNIPITDIQSVPVSNSNPEDTISSKMDVEEMQKLSFDEEVKDNVPRNNIRIKLKQKRGSLKNSHKTKIKGCKIISPQLNNDKRAEKLENVDLPQDKDLKERENLEDVPAALGLEKSKENILSIDEAPRENCEPRIQSETEKHINESPISDKTNDRVENSSKNSQEPPIKIIINKQKTRRKSKSFKKVDLKGQNDLFEDFALVIKKPKRIVPIVAFTSVDTFPKDIYQSPIKKPVEQPPPVQKSAPEEVMEELTEDLDASVEEMDMELDEIPITSNIIENLSFTATPLVTSLFGKADIKSMVETPILPENGNALIVSEREHTLIASEKENTLILPKKENTLILPEEESILIIPEKGNASIVPEKGDALIVSGKEHTLVVPEKQNEARVTKKRGRPAKKKALKDIQIEELFQPPEKDLPLSVEVEEEFLYETTRRSTRKKSTGDTAVFVQEANASSKKPKPKSKDKNSLDTSLELAEDINRFDCIPEKLDNTEVNSADPPTGKFVDKIVESVANIFDFISAVRNDDEGRAKTEESPISNKKPKKLKYNDKREVQADLEGDPTDISDVNDLVAKEGETLESSSSETKPKRNKRKKSKANLDIESVEEPANVNSTLIPDPSLNKEKDIDSIYAFTELDDLEIDLPIEKPKRMSRKQTKSLSESIEPLNVDSLKDKLVDGPCDTRVVPVMEDVQKDLEPNNKDNIDEEIVSKSVTKKRSRSGRDIFNANPENKEEIINTGEIKENNINADVPENGRRKSIRSAKVKALEHIHDDALAELTESERNRDLDKDKTIPTEDSSTISDELSKKKCNKKQSKAQAAQKLPENPELSIEGTENSILTSEEIKKILEPELNIEEIISLSQDESTKETLTTKPSKAQKVELLDGLEMLPDNEQNSQLLANFAEDLTGLEELENSIERELNTPQAEVKRKAKPVKNKPKQTQDSVIISNESNIEGALKNDLLIEENNQELRRSRRGSRKIASYNENDLIDPLLDEIDGKRKNRKKEKAEDTETIPAKDTKVVKKTRGPEKKLNSDELFDLLKASSKENVCIPKASNSFLNNLDETSRDFNDENFENVFENILEQSTLLIQNTVVDKCRGEMDIDKIYEFTDGPESDDQVKDDFLPSECKRKIHKKLPRRNLSPPKLQAEDNSNSVLNAPASDTFSIPTTPDLHDSSVDSKTRPTKTDKTETLDKTNYCEICNRSFIRAEKLMKHKETVTHVKKLTEIEAKQAANKSKVEEIQNESSKTSNSIIEITSDSSKVTSDLSKTEINISDILQESDKPSGVHSPVVHSSFTNNHSLNLVAIITDVLNKPQPDFRPYMSFGKSKSFDSETAEPQSVPMGNPSVSKTAIVEKQIGFLQNILGNKSDVNYEGVLMSAINSLGNNVLENNSVRESPSELSLKQDDSSNIPYARNELLKPNTDDNFLKPSQYEEISEDSVNLRSYEDQKLRKTLNRDEELFLECCSLLKSGSEVSSYSNKKSHNKVLNTMGLKQCDEPEWLERKSLVQKPLYEVAHDYSDDNSRIPTPLGDSYDDDASNSNTISSNWNMNKKVPIFEDISQEKQDSANNSFTFEEVLNEYEEHETTNKAVISKFGEILSETINTQINAVQIRTPLITENNEVNVSKNKQDELNDGTVKNKDKKIIISKGAKKIFEGLKVSIPTEELNLDEVLNCSPKSKKMEIANIQNLTKESPSSQSKPLRTARKSKPVKNKSQFGSNLLFKMNKKKVLSPTGTKKKDDDDVKTHDVYDFEETQDNTDVFTKPDFRTFRSMKTNEIVPEPESDTESRDYLDSFSVEAQSMTSSMSSSSSKKPKTQENITKKKCMIMGRIFKNAAKSKMEDIDEEIRDIPIIDNSELIESYVANCKKIIKNEEVAKPKLSEKEINQLFDQLLENKLDNLDTAHSDARTTVKSKSVIRKIDNKKKLKAKNRKRPRTNSESTDDEFSLNKTTKKRAYRKNAKAEDNCINLEQELKECIGVASRKSQRKCTSGKQNVLVEYWSSDDSQFEALLESQRIESRQSSQIAEDDDKPVEADLLPQIQEDLPVENILIEPPKSAISETSEKVHKPKNVDKKPQLKRKLSSERKPKTNGTGNSKNIDTITSNRRKRAAANPLYHWSSSSEDESQDLIEVKPIRDELEDDEDRPVQHGWIVGDSPKKLVTMLAQAKGKKTDIDCVKEQGKKRTNAVS